MMDKPGNIIFERGAAYWGKSTIDPSRRKIFVITCRHGRRVSFSHVNDVIRCMPDDIDEVEVAKLRDKDGHDYVLSARVPVDIDAALEVAQACNARQ